ncbi:MAG: hypothetical protein ACKVOO_07880, partial [Burkholderiaceae bacterium]
RISEGYKADKAACKPMSANAKDVCIEEAKAKEKVARAELEYGYTAKPSDQTKLMKVKADSAYAVAKEKCDDKSGNDKRVCVAEAKAVQVKTTTDAKMGEKISNTRMDGAQDKLNADYNVATQKCDAMAADAKTACMAAARAKFGKT